VRFGLHLGALRPSLWPDVTAAADALGYESVWMPEHLVVPLASDGSPHDGSDHPPIPSDVPIFDPFAMLGFLAARTTRIKLGTHVYNIGLRHPFTTARAAATVDVLSGGRLLLGIGASWLRAEWEAVGLDFDTRGARVDEAIEVCRRLWTEPVTSFAGAHFQFGPTAFEPKPHGIGLHVGGDGPAALRRAATVGAGWMPMNHTVADLPASVDRLRHLADGRPVDVTISAVTSPSDDDIARWEAAGATRLIVRPWARSSEAIDAITAFADRHLSR
jgi:probable F420-dependent oxidoreductase